PTNNAKPIHPRDLWSDDPSQPDYNQQVQAPYIYSHEKLRRADRLYDLVILTDWNWPNAIKNRGSAIFIHRWRKPGHPTEGCIGLRPTDLAWIAPRLLPTTRLIVL
nr:L,D-transpeptidase family protein [Octadecabacter sp.]